jgi:hypothetical protein
VRFFDRGRTTRDDMIALVPNAAVMSIVESAIPEVGRARSNNDEHHVIVFPIVLRLSPTNIRMLNLEVYRVCYCIGDDYD